MSSLALLLCIASVVGCALGANPVRWEYNFQSPQAAVNPTVIFDIILVPTNTTLYAFREGTGEVIWTFDYPSGDKGGYAAASADLVTVGCLNAVYGLSLNGQLMWSFAAPASPNRTMPWNHLRPSIGVGVVYVTTGFTPLLKLNSATGTIVWQADASLGIAQLHATELGSFVYVVSAIGSTEYALCLEVSTANALWNVSGVVTIIVAKDLGLLFSQGGNASASTLRANYLVGGRLAYELVFNGMASLDYYVFNQSLYVDVGPTSAAYPTSIIKYNGVTGAAQWTTQGIAFLFFIPCSKGIVNFGPEHASAYDGESGVLKWKYAGTAVNDGAATQNDVIIMITSTSVIALKF